MRDPVTQEYSSGCGIACLAFLLNISQKRAIRLLELNHHDATYRGVYCREIVRVLRLFGYSAHFQYVTPTIRRDIYRDGTIVFIERSHRYPVGHYLCRWNGVWMDPWINAVNNPALNRMKSGWRNRLPGRPVYVIFAKRA